MKKLSFQKYLFNVSLNNLSVAKYQDKDGRVVLVVEKNGMKVRGFEKASFSSQENFERWMDKVVDDNTPLYNRAAALSLVLDKLESVR